MLNGDEVEEAEFTDLYGKLTAKMQSCKKSSHIETEAQVQEYIDNIFSKECRDDIQTRMYRITIMNDEGRLSNAVYEDLEKQLTKKMLRGLR